MRAQGNSAAELSIALSCVCVVLISLPNVGFSLEDLSNDTDWTSRAMPLNGK